MDVQMLTDVLMWCMVLNGALLIVSFLFCAFAGDWVFQMHRKWFPMPRETYNVVIYSFLGSFKILVLIFNVVPYVALRIVG